MRAAELFEVDPIDRFIGRRLDQRIRDLWMRTDVDTALSSAQDLELFLESLGGKLSGDAELQRALYLRQVRDFIKFLTS